MPDRELRKIDKIMRRGGLFASACCVKNNSRSALPDFIIQLINNNITPHTVYIAQLCSKNEQYLHFNLCSWMAL